MTTTSIHGWFPDIDSQKLEKIRLFTDEVKKCNPIINLVSKKSIEVFEDIHLADSIFTAKAVLADLGGGKLFDFGSGNGLPGVIFSILDENREITLVDRDERKLEFLMRVKRKLSLENLQTRKLNLGEAPEFMVSHAVTRAMAPLGELLAICEGHFSDSGVLYAMKSTNFLSELGEKGQGGCEKWEIERFCEYKLPGSGQERVVVKAIHN